MKNLNRILVPIDFSDASANALNYAILLADQVQASLDVLHVTPVEGTELEYGVFVAEITQQRVEAAKEQLKGFVARSITATEQMLKEAPLLSYDAEMGSAVTAICETVKSKKYDIVIIGSRGTNRSTLEKLMGSVANGVVRNASCPVLVIPQGAAFSKIDALTYATDINSADPFEIWKMLKLIKPFQPKLRLIHITREVSKSVDEKLLQIVDFFKENVPSLAIETRQVYGTDIEGSINKYVKVNPCDLLVMYQGKHGFWDSLLFKSSTSKMTSIAKVPLLILKEN